MSEQGTTSQSVTEKPNDQDITENLVNDESRIQLKEVQSTTKDHENETSNQKEAGKDEVVGCEDWDENQVPEPPKQLKKFESNPECFMLIH